MNRYSCIESIDMYTHVYDQSSSEWSIKKCVVGLCGILCRTAVPALVYSLLKS